MTLSGVSTEPTPIIESLLKFIERGTDYVRKSELARGNLHFWTSSVRSQLAKIYGKDAPQLAYFPLVTSDFPNHLIREELSKRVAHLIQIVESLRDLVKVTQMPLAGKRIFIGHGRSPLWRELKDFIADRLGLP